MDVYNSLRHVGRLEFIGARSTRPVASAIRREGRERRRQAS